MEPVDPLTEAEHGILAKLDDLVDDLTTLITGGVCPPANPSARGDMNYAYGHVYALRNMVLAQAAAFDYPHMYRALGQPPPPEPKVVAEESVGVNMPDITRVAESMRVSRAAVDPRLAMPSPHHPRFDEPGATLLQLDLPDRMSSQDDIRDFVEHMRASERAIPAITDRADIVAVDGERLGAYTEPVLTDLFKTLIDSGRLVRLANCSMHVTQVARMAAATRTDGTARLMWAGKVVFETNRVAVLPTTDPAPDTPDYYANQYGRAFTDDEVIAGDIAEAWKAGFERGIDMSVLPRPSAFVDQPEPPNRIRTRYDGSGVLTVTLPQSFTALRDDDAAWRVEIPEGCTVVVVDGSELVHADKTALRWLLNSLLTEYVVRLDGCNPWVERQARRVAERIGATGRLHIERDT